MDQHRKPFDRKSLVAASIALLYFFASPAYCTCSFALKRSKGPSTNETTAPVVTPHIKTADRDSGLELSGCRDRATRWTWWYGKILSEGVLLYRAVRKEKHGINKANTYERRAHAFVEASNLQV